MSKCRQVLFFGDVHIPYHSEVAVDLLVKVVTAIKPTIIVCLGDLLDCAQFSTHPPSWAIQQTQYASDVAYAQKFLGKLRKYCEKLVIIEGNHEYRIKRWAARCPEGSGVYDLINPERHLTYGLSAKYVAYGGAAGTYPHYRVNERIVAVHGWSYAKNAARVHLQAAQGRSVIFGHTHRAESLPVQDIWRPGRIIEARGAGCLSKLVPLYGIGSPVEWVHAFVLGYLGRRSDTLYTVPIMGERCILPDGREISV